MRTKKCLAMLPLITAMISCNGGGGGAESVSHQRIAVTAEGAISGMPVFTLSGWDPALGPQQGAWIEAVQIEGKPSSPEHLERQAAYLRAAATKIPEWRSQGLSEDDIQARQAELKLQIVGE